MIKRSSYLSFDKITWKYLLALPKNLSFFCLFSGGALLYLINQNYDTFIKLSYNYNPQIVDHLLKEKSLINAAFIVYIIGVFLYALYCSIRTYKSNFYPIKYVEKHMIQTIEGKQNLSPIRIRKENGLQDFINTYNKYTETLTKSSFDDGLTDEDVHQHLSF